MKENQFLKTVTDRQMPDLEAIREKCINQTPQNQSKAKILTFKSSRFIAVAAVSALALTGMIAALAMPGGLIFKQPENPPVTATTDAPTEPATKEKISHTLPAKEKPKSSSNGENSGKGDESDAPKTSTELCILRMQDAGYEIDELYDLGKAGDYNICLAKSGDGKDCSAEYIIGDYVFKTDTRYSPYGPALFAVGEEQVFTLEDAYRQRLFGDDFNDVVELVKNADETGDFSVTVDDNGAKQVHFREFYNNPDTLTLANLGTAGETEICYVITDMRYDGESEIKLGDYTFSMNGSQAINPHGLFVVYYDEVYTLDNALELGIVDDLDTVMEVVLSKADVIDYNWSVSKDEPQEDDNIETTEAIEETTKDENE